MKQGLPCSGETEIKITAMCVYPFKGIFTEEKYDFLDIGEFGVKYDREL